MVIGLGSDAGNPGSNPVDSCKYIRVKECVLYICGIVYFYICVNFGCSFMLIFLPLKELPRARMFFLPSYSSNE